MNNAAAESPLSQTPLADLEEMLRQQIALGPVQQRPEDARWVKDIANEIARRQKLRAGSQNLRKTESATG